MDANMKFNEEKVVKQEPMEVEEANDTQDYKDVLALANCGDDDDENLAGSNDDGSRISDVAQIASSGVPLDWLLRSRQAESMESAIHLLEIFDKWFHKFNTKVLLTILKKYEDNDGKLIPNNNATRLDYRRRSGVRGGDEAAIVAFVKRLLEAIEKEQVIWKKSNATKGFHRALRVAWLNISLQLGGWGSRDHISYLKGLYRRKRDIYNGEYLRGKNAAFQYVEEMKFLNGSLGRHTHSGDSTTVDLLHFVNTCMPGFDFDAEIGNAPDSVKNLFADMMNNAEQIRKDLGDEAVAFYFTKCVNQLHQYRETSALHLVSDEQWAKVPNNIKQMKNKANPNK